MSGDTLLAVALTSVLFLNEVIMTPPIQLGLSKLYLDFKKYIL